MANCHNARKIELGKIISLQFSILFYCNEISTDHFYGFAAFKTVGMIKADNVDP